MISGSLLREARKRSNLTQAELGRRVSRPQSAIARWESGTVQPSFETLRELIRACGEDLVIRFAKYDDSYDAHIAHALALSPEQRLADGVRRSQLFEQIRQNVNG